MTPNYHNFPALFPVSRYLFHFLVFLRIHLNVNRVVVQGGDCLTTQSHTGGGISIFVHTVGHSVFYPRLINRIGILESKGGNIDADGITRTPTRELAAACVHNRAFSVARSAYSHFAKSYLTLATVINAGRRSPAPRNSEILDYSPGS